MPVKTDQLEITPYTSTVPLVQMPPDAMGGSQPSGPLPGQWGGKKGSGALAIGDALLKGFLAGHEKKAAQKQAEARATISAADAAQQSAFTQYQDALSKAGGDVKNPDAAAAYQAYLGVFNQAKEAKAKFVLPDKPQKGQKAAGGEKGAKGEKKTGFGGIKEFFEANPHIVPQIALMTMQPQPPGLSRESKLQNLEMKTAEQQAKIGDQNIALNDQAMQQNKETEQRVATERKVHESGGIDSVLADAKAPPELKQAANRMKFEVLDKETPEGKMKEQLLQDVQGGKQKNWTPEQRVLAGSLGIVPQMQAQVTMGKNGHQQQILVDPLTNQPMPGSKPLDLGPPAWANEYYAKRAADRADLKKAVTEDPAAYGITVGTDPKANKAAIDARVDSLYVKATFGIQSLADQFGKTGYEVQRDNDLLQGLVKEVQLNGKSSWLDQKPPTMTYSVDTKGADGKTIKGGQPIQVGREYFAKILNQFVTSPSENGGVMGFRDISSNPDGKSPETLESERRFMYQFVKNKLLTETGKKAMTPEQADAFLKNTALGRPVNASSAGLQPPPQSSQQSRSNPFGPPPQAGPGDWNRGTNVTDEDLAKQ